MQFISILLFSSTLTLAHAEPVRVVLDAGHGGRDSGAMYENTKESSIALAVCRELEAALKESGEFEVYLTRKTDQFKSLPARAVEANKFRGDLFISIHVNASRDERARGAEFYFQNQLPAEEEAQFLAAKENGNIENLENFKLVDFSHYKFKTPNHDVVNILEDLSRQTRLKLSHKLAQSLILSWDHKGRSFHKSLRQAPFYLFSNLKMPAVLVEVGFLTNEKDAKELSSSDFHKQVARNILKGIKSFTL